MPKLDSWGVEDDSTLKIKTLSEQVKALEEQKQKYQELLEREHDIVKKVRAELAALLAELP